MGELRKGTVSYTERGFHQDTDDAMKGDIVRGIIEAVTNADDAYRREGASKGKIVVEVEHRRQSSWLVRIRDRATGIPDLVGMTDIGARTSGFETGQAVRGTLGRGAKDLAAFGPVTFSTIVDGRFQQLILSPDGHWVEKAPRDASAEDRNELGVPRGNGTVVEIDVNSSIRCPRHDTLKNRLTSHFELREILIDPKREVQLVNLNDGTRDILVYIPPESELVFEDEVLIPDYESVIAQVTIRRLNERSDDVASDPGRTNGLVVRGHRGAYEVSLFGFEGDFYAAWFEGEIRCLHIDVLQREFDDLFEKGKEYPAGNPVQIISRQRDGLRRDHPFVQALIKAVEDPLGEAVAAERERARQEEGRLESESTRNAMELAGRELAKLVDQELREIEAEELIGGGLGEGDPPPLSLVPEVAYAYIGEDRTLTVAANAAFFEEGDHIRLSVDPGGVVEVLTTEVVLKRNVRREDILVSQVQLRPLLADEMTIVTVRGQDHSAAAIVEVQPEREIIEEEIEPPEGLEFERTSYRVGIGKQKKLLLRAPAGLVAREGAIMHASSDDPGVVVRTPTSEFMYNEEFDFYITEVVVEARGLGATSVVTAQLGQEVATTAVKVTRKEEGPNIVPRLVDEDMGTFRGVLVKENDPDSGEQMVLKVSTHHKALRPYFGESGEGQNSPACRSIIAEVMADTAARHVVGELFRARRTLEEFDADRLYREHYRRVERLLPPLQRLLVGDPEMAWTTSELEPSPLFEDSPVRSSSVTTGSEN